MRILQVITSLHTGGAETLVVNMIPRMAEQGHQVDLVVFNGGRTDLTERLEKECSKCRIYSLGSSYYNPWYIVKLARIMRQYDIVHTHNSSPQLFAAIANIVCRRKLVTTEHNTNNRKRHNRLLTFIDKWMYGRYEKTICISDQAEQNLRTHLNDNHSRNSAILTIYNGVDVEKINHAEPIPTGEIGRCRVVMVAAFRAQKDQDTLIRAMQLLPKNEYELWLVGDGERRPLLESFVKELYLEDRVKLLGLRTDVPNILKAADVVVMSSHWEGLSLSNIEGMAAGKPFIASDVDGLREVTKGYGLLFPHGDAEALADIIRKLTDDKDYYNEIARRCYERAQQFDIKTTVEGYLKVYESLMSP